MIFLFSPNFNFTFKFRNESEVNSFVDLNPGYYIRSTKEINSNRQQQIVDVYHEYGPAGLIAEGLIKVTP